MTSKREIFSNSRELDKIAQIITAYLRLPIAGDSIPGSFMESAIATVRGGRALGTYDFVDVVSERFGWQVKSTKMSTPVTWKRAKIPNQKDLIHDSFMSKAATQELGDRIIQFCNDHAVESFEKHKLSHIGYARLIYSQSQIMYFERLLASRDNPTIFCQAKYSWHWSEQKKTSKKEQLRALHATDKETGKKMFAWHGLGENQLHYSGESQWWPNSEDPNQISFTLPDVSQRLTFDELVRLIAPVA